eukprot:6489726-Amphidinium_carterae.1
MPASHRLAQVALPRDQSASYSPPDTKTQGTSRFFFCHYGSDAETANEGATEPEESPPKDQERITEKKSGGVADPDRKARHSHHHQQGVCDPEGLRNVAKSRRRPEAKNNNTLPLKHTDTPGERQRQLQHRPMHATQAMSSIYARRRTTYDNDDMTPLMFLDTPGGRHRRQIGSEGAATHAQQWLAPIGSCFSFTL